MVTIIFQVSNAAPIIKRLIKIISEFKVKFNYLSDLDGMFYTKPLKDSECKGGNYFFKLLMSCL